jgi:hypothetical protein
MPKELPQTASVGGKFSPIERDEYLRKLQEIMLSKSSANSRYRDVTEDVMMSPAILGDKTRNGEFTPKTRTGRYTMPKAFNLDIATTTISGKRGRKAIFSDSDFVLEIGKHDITEEMLSEILSDDANLDEEFQGLTPEDLYFGENGDDNEVGAKYRKNRFDAMKRAAVKANGKDSRYLLSYAKDGDDFYFVMERTK